MGSLSGLLEVGVVLLRKHVLTADRSYRMSEHFVWMVPLINLAIFLAVGLVLSPLLPGKTERRAAGSPRAALATLTLLPACLAAFPWIHGLAVLLVVVGSRHAACADARAACGRPGPFILFSFPAFAALVAILALSVFGPQWNAQRREEARPLPAEGSANVLLIVLDTVGADHLSLHGYDRPTSPTLDELASRAIRFDRAQAPSSWTLPSHATMFTGMWPHELSVGWLTPLDGASPTLAEYLERSRLRNGRLHRQSLVLRVRLRAGPRFHDLSRLYLPPANRLEDSQPGSWPIAGIHTTVGFIQSWLDSDLFQPALTEHLAALRGRPKRRGDHQSRASRLALRRPTPDRPFFAFLNYFDAHYPYELPEPGIRRFTTEPTRRSRSQADEGLAGADRALAFRRNRSLRCATPTTIAWPTSTSTSVD